MKKIASSIIAASVIALIAIWAFCFSGTASAQTVYIKDTVSYHQCGATTQKGTPCKILVKNGTKYCYHHNKPTVPTDPTDGKTIYEGPRGGHYYLETTADGTIKKVYIKTK